MYALITGATSGIGLDIAKVLSKRNYKLILVGRDFSKIKKEDFETEIIFIKKDLKDLKSCYELYEETKKYDIDVFINNAGFGLFGNFTKTSLEKELEMINVNVIAVHTLLKFYLKDMVKKNRGYILNTASAAAFAYGPLMSTYYATKSYVYKLTLSIYEELKRNNSKVIISCLTPGPVDTNFNDVANVRFAVKSLKSDYVAEYAVKNLFKNKLIITPGLSNKLVKIFVNIIPVKIILYFSYGIQKRKKD